MGNIKSSQAKSCHELSSPKLVVCFCSSSKVSHYQICLKSDLSPSLELQVYTSAKTENFVSMLSIHSSVLLDKSNKLNMF